MSGLPTSATIDTYGGALADYGVGAVDPETDRAAAQANVAYADCAAMTRTAVRCACRFKTHATTPILADDGNFTWDAVWKTNTTTAPTFARTSQGLWVITWPVTITDELGSLQAVNLRDAKITSISGATFVHAQVVRTTANTLTVYTMDAAGAVQDFAGTYIGVEAF